MHMRDLASFDHTRLPCATKFRDEPRLQVHFASKGTKGLTFIGYLASGNAYRLLTDYVQDT